ncbi:MAG: hypothetical protein ACR2LJ_12905 [Acidimicrobiales bacterium]
MNGEGAPLKGAPTDGLPATSSVAQAALELVLNNAVGLLLDGRWDAA